MRNVKFGERDKVASIIIIKISIVGRLKEPVQASCSEQCIRNFVWQKSNTSKKIVGRKCSFLNRLKISRLIYC